MDLGERGRGERLGREVGEQAAERGAQLLRHDLARPLSLERCRPFIEAREGQRISSRDDVGPKREALPCFDEGGAEPLGDPGERHRERLLHSRAVRALAHAQDAPDATGEIAARAQARRRRDPVRAGGRENRHDLGAAAERATMSRSPGSRGHARSAPRGDHGMTPITHGSCRFSRGDGQPDRPPAQQLPETAHAGPGCPEGTWRVRASGSATMNRAPRPRPPLSAHIRPPCAAMIASAMVRPMPLPPLDLARAGSTR